MTRPMPLYTSALDNIRALAHNDSTLAPLAIAVPFDLTNVYSWLITDKTGASLGDLISDLPTCVPPYPHCFFEYPPSPADDPEFLRQGILVFTHKREKRLTRDDDVWTIPAALSRSTEPHRSDPRPVIDVMVPAGGFISIIRPVYMMKYPDGVAIVPFDVAVGVGFDPDGNLLTGNGRIAFTTASETYDEDQLRAQLQPNKSSPLIMASDAAFTALFSCSLMHCTNIEEREERLPRQLARQRERRNLPPIVYKTLYVQPMRKPRTASDADDLIAERHKRRLHLVRGHYAEFGMNGKGKLFGKYSGRFWIPPMVKGNAGVGSVVKNYALSGGTESDSR